MGIYQNYIMPRVITAACGTKPMRRQRQKIVPQAEGAVLEVGAGAGLNFEFYDRRRLQKLIALDPAKNMNRMARRRAKKMQLDVEFLRASGQSIPLPPASVDTVVLTYTLCSIPVPVPALKEMRRVLKPEGRLLFCEHGRAPDYKVRQWQKRLNPLWGKIGGGCVLTRDVPTLLREGGFAVHWMEMMYLPGTPRFVGFNYWGTARLF